MVDPPSLPLGQSRSRSLSASQTSLARFCLYLFMCHCICNYDSIFVYVFVVVFLSGFSQMNDVELKINQDTILNTNIRCFTDFLSIPVASLAWVASSRTSSLPVVPRPGQSFHFIIFPRVGQSLTICVFVCISFCVSIFSRLFLFT